MNCGMVMSSCMLGMHIDGGALYAGSRRAVTGNWDHTNQPVRA